MTTCMYQVSPYTGWQELSLFGGCNVIICF